MIKHNDQKSTLKRQKFDVIFVFLTRCLKLFIIFSGGLGLNFIGISFVQAQDTTEMGMSVATSPNPAIINRDLTYSVTVFPVTSVVSSTVNNVILTYGLPPNFVLVSAKTSQGTCQTRGVVECQLGTLAQAATVTVVVTPTSTGSISSVFSVTGMTADGKLTNKNEPVDVVVNQPAPVQIDFSETRYEVEESQGVAIITVNRSGDSDRALFVDYTTRDGSAIQGQDYELAHGTLSWGRGDTTPKTFTVPLIDDFENEEDEEIVHLTLTNPQESTIGQGQAQLIIKDNDISGEVGFNPTTYTINEGAETVSVTVLRTGGQDGTLTVSYLTIDETAIAGEDYQAAQGTLFWEHGEFGEKEIVINLLNDDIPEWAETFTLRLITPSNRATINESQALATITIQDDNTRYDAVGLLTDVAQNPTQRAIATTLGQVCQAGQTSADLGQRCQEMLIQTRFDPTGVSRALQQVAPEEFAVQGRLSVDAASRQIRNIYTRLMAVRSGAVGGSLTMKDLEVNINDQAVPLPKDAEFRLYGKPLSSPAGGPLLSGPAHAFDLNKLGAFINGHIGFGDRDTSDNESGFEFQSLGLTAGVDYRFTDSFILGLALGYHQAATDLYQESGSIDAEGLNLSVYGTFYKPKKFYLDLLASYGIASYDNNRHILYTLGETLVDQVATSNHDGDQQVFSVSAGYHFNFGILTFTPTARMDQVSASIDNFTESLSNLEGPGSGFALAIDNQDIKSLTLALGTQISLEIKRPSGTVFIPQVHLEWVKESKNKQRWIKGRFLDDASGQTFMIPTDEADAGYANLGVGLAIQVDNSLSAFLNYETILGLDYTKNHSLMAGVRMEF